MSRLRSAMPVNGTLPASLILGSREQKQYRRFQAQNNNLRPQAYGTLPTAEQYAEFQSWCQKNDSGYFSDTPLGDLITSIHCEAQNINQGKKVSATCGHVLHQTQWYEPARETVERCPVCIVEMHTTYMNILMQALRKAGGYMEQRWEAAPPSNPILEAFYAGKIAVIHAIAEIEQLVVVEESWDETNPSSNTEGDGNIKTAHEALRIYWTGIEGSASDSMSSSYSSLYSPTSSSPCKVPQKKQKKGRVSFSEDTDFERGRDQHYFWRKSPRYEPGGKYDITSSSSSASLSDEHLEEDDSDTSDKEDDGTTTRLPIRLDYAMILFEETLDNTDDGTSVEARAQGVEAATEYKGEGESDDSDAESDILSDSDSDDEDLEADVDSEDEENDDDDEEGSFIEFGY
ncbi:hypothetical protein DM02DRAFT_144264 [Periconia macrospinosa]|uniref:Uncharacterized protein n=1 Tax=Periconia macrospinosa TaxID=97972 RepID=A0A2V1E5A4_9PLEO|nr:hypothetical protein DM02DRAFT_144264 [Periconia macrospinosa]